MPSVAMRRTMRVFTPRVLRSGRRLWSGSSVGMHTRASGGVDWIELLDNSGIGCKQNVGLKQKITKMNIEENVGEKTEMEESDLVVNNDRMWGSVYERKRKRVNVGSCDFDLNLNLKKKRALEHRKYGIQFSRRKTRALTAFVESCGSGSVWFVCFLNLVLRYMRRVRVRLSLLSAFLVCDPLALAFSSEGIHFLYDSPPVKRSGMCKIFGARCLIPLFAVDFSAIPSCFMYLHSRMFLRSTHLHVLVMSSSGMDANDDKMSDDDENPLLTSSERDSSGSKTVASGNTSFGKKRTVRIRNGVSTRSIQKTRSSLRLKRVRNSSVFSTHKTNGVLLSELLSFSPLSLGASKRGLRSSVRRTTKTNIKELKSTMAELTQDLDSTSCSVHILVVESDKCYREENAIVMLEMAASKKWYIAVKRDGITRYSLMAKKVMRPCSCNRVTHDIIWTEDNKNSWKLEFPNRQDWWVFKELYRECSERNVRAPKEETIPVPVVHEVPDYANNYSVHFARPDSYIKWKDDELSRALVKRAANYDMDTEDELWLKKINNELDECVSEESFELIIDGFEKGFYCSPDDYSDEQAAVNLCRDVEKREVVEAVFGYWTKKRKKKRSALIRVFQLYQPKRTQVSPKSVRKKRSFKRKPSKSGRGKQRTFLQGMAAQYEAFDELSALLKAQEAKVAASKSEGFAILVRRKAQILMQSVDLATYRATMALRIAEAAQAAESPDSTSSFFLH